MKHIIYVSLFSVLFVITACGGKQRVVSTDEDPIMVGPVFNEDSALAFCAEQCNFGPRTMNSEAHEKCGEWIVDKFKQYGCDVRQMKADLKGWDGTTLHATNIIASINKAAKRKIIICAHWDCRPWADNDPDSTNWHKPVMAANDAASGVAVMLELARVIQNDSVKLPYDIVFVCFDAEDYGAPQWSGIEDEKSWALGAQYFAENLPEIEVEGGKYECGILLDMVGGQGAHFYQEGLSKYYAKKILEEVWQAAEDAGYSSFFLNSDGANVTDDHKPLNDVGIPTIDIIPYYPDCPQSGFGPTWHTVNDDMQHLDKATLKAVGQTIVQYLYTRR